MEDWSVGPNVFVDVVPIIRTLAAIVMLVGGSIYFAKRFESE